ncbi:MAG: hypothetical protein ACI9OB_000360 [Nonlabens sp.]|jgi:hypothetical protein
MFESGWKVRPVVDRSGLDGRKDEEMSKRYREVIKNVVLMHDTGESAGDGHEQRPAAFTWRGHEYLVTSVLGHWREDAGWWRRPSGEPIKIEQTDMWRVEARNGKPMPGVYEIVRKGDAWLLDRVWD